jgi:hypothetical protein
MRSDDDAMMALVPTTWLDKNPQYFSFPISVGGGGGGVGRFRFSRNIILLKTVPDFFYFFFQVMSYMFSRISKLI